MKWNWLVLRILLVLAMVIGACLFGLELPDSAPYEKAWLNLMSDESGK